MKKTLPLVFAIILFSSFAFASYTLAAFDPNSQTVVDLGNVPGTQNISAQANTPSVSSNNTDYEWYTPPLQEQIDSLNVNGLFLDAAILDGIILN